MNREPRSWLCCSGTRTDSFDTAISSGTEAIILDWERLVTPADKQTARKSVIQWLLNTTPRVPIWIRINSRDSKWWQEDLDWIEEAPADRVAGVLLPRTRFPSDIADTHAHLNQRHGVVPLIECAEGIHNAAALAAAPGVVTLALGGSSFQVDARLGDDDHAWIYPRSSLVFACRAANLNPPLDRADTRIDDPRVVGRSARAAATVGMGGKLCVHRNQIPIVNTAFNYTPHQRAWALRVVAAAKHGSLAVWVDGETIDSHRIELARHIVAYTS